MSFMNLIWMWWCLDAGDAAEGDWEDSQAEGIQWTDSLPERIQADSVSGAVNTSGQHPAWLQSKDQASQVSLFLNIWQLTPSHWWKAVLKVLIWLGNQTNITSVFCQTPYQMNYQTLLVVAFGTPSMDRQPSFEKSLIYHWCLLRSAVCR